MIKKLTTSEFISKARKIHGNRYDYSKCDYRYAIKNVIIICKIHGKFDQTPNNHLSAKGCIKCGFERSANSYRLNTQYFIKKAIEVYKNKYNYSLVDYVNARTKIKIVCPVHGKFLQIPRSHLRNCGCPKCGSESSSKIRASNIKEFIKKSKKIHGDRYDYSCAKYATRNTKIKIICKKHGIFLQTPNSHFQGSGCPTCGIISFIKTQKNKIVPEETRKNMRLSAIKRIERQRLNGGQLIPGYNSKACKFIEKYGKQHGYNFQHAMNGGEFYIKELGYWVDGYDVKKNVIFEYDEIKHTYKKLKDKMRQIELIKFLKPTKFIRYNEKNDKLYEIKI